jgi:RecG-like helicase
VEIVSASVRGTRRPGFKIFEALLRDSTGYIRAAFLNQPFLKDVLRPHERVFLYGQVEMKIGALQLATSQNCSIAQTAKHHTDASCRSRRPAA